MATKRHVETKLRELIRRLEQTQEARGSLAGSLPDRRVISVEVTDLDTEYWTEIARGVMGALQEGSPGRADIRISAGSDQLVEIIDGRSSLLSSVLSGQVKVQASVPDLLRLRQLG